MNSTKKAIAISIVVCLSSSLSAKSFEYDISDDIKYSSESIEKVLSTKSEIVVTKEIVKTINVSKTITNTTLPLKVPQKPVECNWWCKTPTWGKVLIGIAATSAIGYAIHKANDKDSSGSSGRSGIGDLIK